MRSFTLTLLLAACGTDAAAVDAMAPEPDATAADAPIDADLFPDDQPFTGDSVDGIIDEWGETRWFQLTSAGGEWLVIEAALHDPASYHMVETALYDARGHLLAESHRDLDTYSLPGALRAYLAEEGAYYLRVTDASTPDLNPFAPLSFTLSIRAPAAPAEYLDPETGDALADAPAIPDPGTPTGLYTFVLGLHEHAGDSDAFAFEVGAGRRLTVNAPQGSPPRLALVDADGEVYARVDLEEQPGGLLFPPVPAAPGSWFVTVDGPTAEVGGSYLLVLAAVDPALVHGYWQPEQEDPTAPGANDDVIGAESIMVGGSRDDPGDPNEVAAVSGRLSTASDVDVFDFPVLAPVSLRVSCAGAYYGSGAHPLLLELLDWGGNVLTRADDAHGDASIPWMPLAPAVYALRVTKLAQDPEVLSDFYRCRMWMLAAL